jgi:hypothetical protein
MMIQGLAIILALAAQSPLPPDQTPLMPPPEQPPPPGEPPGIEPVAPEAQPAPVQPYAPATEPYREPATYSARPFPGAAFQVGGGVSTFTGDIQDTTDPGGLWSARATIGTRSLLGLEAAYVGTATKINALGIDDDNEAGLISNGLEGALRLNLPMMTRTGVLLEPFGFGGIGWTRFDVINHSGPNTSSVSDGDSAFTIPFGGGLAVSANHFLVDARFTYRAQFDDQIARNAGGSELSLGSWSVAAMLGYELW